MNRLPSIVMGAALAAAAVLPAVAGPPPAVRVEAPSRLILAQANCHDIGRQVAAQHGGRLADARPEERGGRTVCVIVVQVPARDGQHPRQETVVVPQ